MASPHGRDRSRDRSTLALTVGGVVAAVALVAGTAVLPADTAPTPEPPGRAATR